MAANDYIPKSRLTITYDMEVEGEKKKKELPMKTLVMGDLSLEGSAAREVPFEERSIYNITSNNIDPAMKHVGAKLDMTIENHINPTDGPIKVKYDVDSMKQFDPNHLVKHIEPAKKLLQVKELLSEFGSMMKNERALRTTLARTFKDDAAREQIKAELPNLGAYQLGVQPEGEPGTEGEQPAGESNDQPEGQSSDQTGEQK